MRELLRPRKGLVLALVLLVATITLAGTASSTAPSVSLTPSSYDFGAQAVGTTSNKLDVLIKNVSTSRVNFNSITVTGDFTLQNFCGGGLSPGFGCDVWVRFVPTASGSRTGMLIVNDSAPDSPHTAVLTGTGTGGSSGGPAVSLSPTSLSFGNQRVGTTSSARTITLSNTGTAALNISSITPSGDFGQTNNCGGSVAAGSNCAIDVTFSPTASGSRNGTLSIFDNASGSPHTASLAGTGTTTPPPPPPPPSGNKHYLYIAGNGAVHVYDIDNGHALVQTINLPINLPLGMGASSQTGVLFVAYGGFGRSQGNGSILAYDLIHNTLLWDVNYSHGVDSIAVTPDGSTLYVPDGENSGDSTWYVVSAADGSEHGTIKFGPGPHNALVSLDGTNVYFGAIQNNFLARVSTASNTITLQAGPLLHLNTTSSFGVRPFTVDGRQRFGFTTAGGFVGFQVSDLSNGSVLWTLSPPGFSPDPTQTAPSHGISLSPTENEIYVIDHPAYVHVYDVSALPAQPVKTFDLALVHQLQCVGWLSHSRDGRYVYVGCSGDVVDTASHTLLTGLPLQSDLAANRYYIEVDWNNSTPTFAMTSRMGQGYVTSPGSSSLSITTTSLPNGTAGQPYSKTLTASGGTTPYTWTTTSTLPAGITLSPNGLLSGTTTQSGSFPLGISVRDSSNPTQTASANFTLTIAATPSGPAVSLSSSSLTFASQQLNTTSPAQNVKLTNTGNQTLTITSIGVTGTNSGDYTQTNDCSSSVAGNNGTCTISVTFTPSAAGTRTAAVTINDNASGSPHTISLSGTGTSTTSGAQVSVAPSSFDFGMQSVGSTTGPLDVRINSVGSARLNIRSITVSGDFTLNNYCGSSLSPGFGCDVWVFFAPKATGTRTGALTVTTDGSGPNTVSLTGTGQ